MLRDIGLVKTKMAILVQLNKVETEIFNENYNSKIIDRDSILKKVEEISSLTEDSDRAILSLNSLLPAEGARIKELK